MLARHSALVAAVGFGLASIRELPAQQQYFGFVDRAGAIAIPLQFDSAGPFRRGVAVVKRDGRFGIIDRGHDTHATHHKEAARIQGPHRDRGLRLRSLLDQ